jgi:hypothetical protein
MALIDEVRKICRRLTPFGWAALLKRHGLDILANDLKKELYRDISKSIDRRVPGFMDYCNTGFSAIQPYNPSMSLLYHALASPNVHPGPGNSPLANNKAYPTIEELDLLENYIFSGNHPDGIVSIRDEKFFSTHFKKESLVITVFAYQYRPGGKSVHGGYADICYSRTGIARMGTEGYQYIGSSRSFWPVPAQTSNAFCIMPARYGAFVAEIRTKTVDGEVMLAQKTDKEQYIFPLHKLFEGEECIAGLNIPPFSFEENHVSEKLRLLFQSLNVKNGFNLDDPPFMRSSGKDAMVGLENHGSSVLLVPVKTKALIEPAKQKTKTVHFTVTPFSVKDDNRYSTSLQIENHGPRFKDARIGPEYINIRFELKPKDRIENLSDQFTAIEEAAFLQKINRGGYKAVVFIDNSCDGCIEIKFSKPFNWITALYPAYSLVAAPDFFPLCDQSDIANWEADNGIKDQFRQGGTDPLFTTREFINPVILSPVTGKSAFDGINKQKIRTTTAMVSMSVISAGNPDPENNDRQVSWLTDSGSGVFAPGWDVSLVTVKKFNYDFLSTAGLGSPFPEDTKLCAALNSFWPAVAPDASRTFIAARDVPDGFFKTALPLLDEELGYHPLHPKVISGSKKASTGWDGEQGVFFEVEFDLVNYCSIDRSDYTLNMLKGLFSIGKISRLDAPEWINRMIALRNCIFVLPPSDDHVSSTRLSVISVEKIERWEDQTERADTLLSGPGYFMEFALLAGNEELTDDPKRRRRKVEESYVCQLSERFLFWRNHRDITFQKVNRSSIPLKW